MKRRPGEWTLKKSTFSKKKYDTKRVATTFVISLGIMSIFADLTYEGSRSILGPWLGLLGLSATAISIITGSGELIGYSFRIFSGRWADRSHNYWPITIFGYVIQMIAVPLMALAGNWAIATWLVIQERFGKAIRNPPRDAMLSHAGKEIGYGWAFGLHEALDQTGAVLGPLAIAGVLLLEHANQIPLPRDYRVVFAILLVPAVITIVLLMFNWKTYPHPEELDSTPMDLNARGLPNSFWIYLGGSMLVGVGMGGFPLIAYHLQISHIVPPVWIPIFYAISMGIAGLGSLFLGRVLDRTGMKILIPLTLASAVAIPLIWFGEFALSIVGIALWGLGTGVQESLIPAIVSKMVPRVRRASAFGILTAGHGISLFLGGVIIGLLYIMGIREIVMFGTLAEIIAIPVFVLVSSKIKI